jgi:hypothetical protein
MNLKLNDTTCGFSQKHRQLVGPAPISIQAQQVKGHDNFYFIFLFRVAVLDSTREEAGKNLYIYSQIIIYSSFILTL